MKTRIMILASIVALLAVPMVSAEYHEEMMGNQMDQQKANSVEEITAVEEGTEVKLEGNIIEKQEENFYLFKDDTGELKLEISDEVWGDREVDPEKKLEIKGTVAKEAETGELYVEVSEIEECNGEKPEHAEQKRQEAQEKREEAQQRRQEAEEEAPEEDGGLF